VFFFRLIHFVNVLSANIIIDCLGLQNGKIQKRTPYTIDDNDCPPTDDVMLQKIVSKHCRTLDRYLLARPVAQHTAAAFAETKIFVTNFLKQDSSRGIILDSGCGTGQSTLALSKMYPNDVIVGIDRSLARLKKNTAFQSRDNSFSSFESEEEEKDGEDHMLVQSFSDFPNVILVRAELSDFWRCSLDAGWRPRKHFVLYPNPYPKKSRLKSRWYAHPSFPLILKVGGDIILRSNWEGYLKEFSRSVVMADEFLSSDKIGEEEENYASPYGSCALAGPTPTPYTTDTVPLTKFEQKYFLCGEPVYELKLDYAIDNKI